MSQSKTHKPSPLILAALHHQEFVSGLPSLTFLNSALTGVMFVDPLQRNDILEMLGKTKLSSPNQTDFIPLFMPSHQFSTVLDSQIFDFNLGYSCDMSEIDDGGNEELSVIFVLNNGHTPVGFFKVTLTHSHNSEHNHMIQFTLDQILINPKHRNSTNWIDLTSGTVTFLSVMLECLVASAQTEDRVDIYLNADAVSKSGRKIGNIIFSELNVLLEELKQDYPQKSKCINQIIYHIG